MVSVRIYLSSAVALACIAAAPAFAGDQASPSWPSFPEKAALASSYADDFPTSAPLRPAVPTNAIDWRGFYLGGDFSYSGVNGDFSGATQAPISYSLRESTLEAQYAPSSWPVLGSASHSAPGGGGFIGYNFVYAMPTSKVVLGVEANYDQASLSLIAPNSPISRVTSGNSYLVNIIGSGQVSNLDFGTLRARAGWAFGNFLPYAFVGAALGRADVNVTETTSGLQNPPTAGACVSPCVPFSFSGTAGKNGEWLYGLTFGGGLDVALTRNIFIRAEYEYVQFQPVATINLNVNTFRAGAGFKF
jgi:outer membrane immunogenic protein